jgi:hypothetical protein
MLFDDINVDTIKQDDELYVNVDQLYNHLAGSTEIFAQESAALAKEFGITREEKVFTMGLIQGMWSVVMMLQQAQDEHAFDSIETVEDLLQRFKDNDAS